MLCYSWVNNLQFQTRNTRIYVVTANGFYGCSLEEIALSMPGPVSTLGNCSECHTQPSVGGPFHKVNSNTVQLALQRLDVDRVLNCFCCCCGHFVSVAWRLGARAVPNFGVVDGETRCPTVRVRTLASPGFRLRLYASRRRHQSVASTRIPIRAVVMESTGAAPLPTVILTIVITDGPTTTATWICRTLLRAWILGPTLLHSACAPTRRDPPGGPFTPGT